ncbi:hypothetical protein D6777_01345 [Candidatus Woesearchaeota archaeon]|nr:MAG: hypothetical protein D6777_01345 [Candidatus Woesearchaeota archaeon]
MVKLICYNVEYFTGISKGWHEYLFVWRYFKPKNVDEVIVEKLKELKPDILALIELDVENSRTKRDEISFIKNKLSLYHAIKAIKYSFKGIKSILKHVPHLKYQGNAIISKYKIYDVKTHSLKKGIHNIVIEAKINCPYPVRLILAHLSLRKKARLKQLKELANIINSHTVPTILMGDLNTQKNDITVLLNSTYLSDAIKLKDYKTFPSWNPQKHLDYVLVSPSIKIKDYKILKYNFSDHLPIYINFDVKV